MDYEIVNLNEKVVVGIKERLNNSQPDLSEKIGSLWQQFYADAYSKIENKSNDITIGLYTNYKNDYKDDYDFYICSEVTTENKNKELFETKIISDKYAKFSIKGDVKTSVGEFWGKLWEMNLDRKYNCDFEEYLPSGDMENMEINIYISIN